MGQQELSHFLEYNGKDPSRLIFEDELTDIYNRRFLFHFFQSKVSWDDLDNSPLSLIMVDVDKFKQVNDTCGHQVGDQALVWVANTLREVAADQGMAIRYAGDEFMLLLPYCNKQCGMQIANRLHEQIHEKPFKPHKINDSPPLTLSIGIATASEDASTGKSLIQKADIALYSAKKVGRDCVVNASEIIQEEVFAKTAINQLADVKMVGRGEQLSRVTEALSRFMQKQNQFLIAEGSAGIGKTEFLETIHRHLTHINSVSVRVKVSGNPQEMFCPYYLVSKILINALNQQKDKKRYVMHLLHYIPERRGQDFDVIEDVIPIYNVNVSLNVEHSVESITLVPNRKKIVFEKNENRIEFVVPEVNGHQIVEIAYD